jgi:hypothetical protein
MTPRWRRGGFCGVAHGFMESPLFLPNLLTGLEPGRARRPCRAGKSAAQVQVERRLTGDGSPYRRRAFARFLGSPLFHSDLLASVNQDGARLGAAAS